MHAWGVAPKWSHDPRVAHVLPCRMPVPNMEDEGVSYLMLRGPLAVSKRLVTKALALLHVCMDR